MKKLCSLIISVIFVASASAQWSQIKSTNVKGTYKYDVLVYTGTSVLMASEGGVQRSTDNGETWALSIAGLDSTNSSVNNLVFIQSRNELWLNTSGRIYKSTNDGVSWSQVTLTGVSPFGWPSQLGRVGNRLLVIYQEWDPVPPGTTTSRFIYSDDGINWTDGSYISYTDEWFDFVNEFNNRLLVFTKNNESPRRFWFTTDGINVAQVPMTGITGDPEVDTENMSIDPQGNNMFFRDRNEKKIYWYNLATESWEVRMNGISLAGYALGEVFGAHTLGNHAFASALFMKAFPPVLPDDMVLKLFYSSDNGQNWTPVSDPGLDFPVFERMMVTAGAGRIIGSYFENLMAYTDNTGQSWTKINEVYGGDFDYLTTLADGSVLAVSPDQMKGIIKSADNGTTWDLFNGDLPDFMGLHLVNAIWPGGPNVNYCTAAEDPFSEKLYLFKTTNGGLNWIKVTTAPDTKAKIFIGRHGAANPIMYFGDGEGTGTYQFTTDQGASWTDLTPAINTLGIEKVLGIKGNGTLMILFAQKNNQVRIYKSTDQGSSFTDITSNLDKPQYEMEILVADRWDWRRGPSALASFSGDGSSFVVAAIDYTVSPNKVFFYALNGTQNGWNKISTAGIDFPHYVECHALRQIGGVWYFVTPFGAYASANNCVTWQRVWNNEGFVNGVRPRSFSGNGNALFMGTEDNGLWKALIYAPTITTNAATEITDVSAKSGGTIVSTGGLPFGSKGICWATHTNPVTSDNVLWLGNSWEDFSATMTSLTPSTQYFVRSFVQSPKGLVYGNEISFTTENPLGIITGREGEIQLYPNPSDGRFSIVSDAEMTMTVMNVIGKVVLSAPVYSGLNSYELLRQPAGIYFVKLTGAGNTEKTIRLIIK
ncbi:MAG TPA: T9SS type A sorting domain-containing protein [Bacteroidales bacterium]|nr:T9SS type A sorting domain-containing protein [Bacteroidales bacterium]